MRTIWECTDNGRRPFWCLWCHYSKDCGEQQAGGASWRLPAFALAMAHDVPWEGVEGKTKEEGRGWGDKMAEGFRCSKKHFRSDFILLAIMSWWWSWLKEEGARRSPGDTVQGLIFASAGLWLESPLVHFPSQEVTLCPRGKRRDRGSKIERSPQLGDTEHQNKETFSQVFLIWGTTGIAF